MFLAPSMFCNSFIVGCKLHFAFRLGHREKMTLFCLSRFLIEVSPRIKLFRSQYIRDAWAVLVSRLRMIMTGISQAVMTGLTICAEWNQVLLG
jgi:hypothetical protein